MALAFSYRIVLEAGSNYVSSQEAFVLAAVVFSSFIEESIVIKAEALASRLFVLCIAMKPYL